MAIKNKIEKLIKEVGVNEVENILQEMKSNVDVKEELKKDFIELISGCKIFFDGNNIVYQKDTDVLFYYKKNENYFYFSYNIWFNFENKYDLNCEELKDLLVGLVEEVLNYKCVTSAQAFTFQFI